jgi:hypothetical protein
MQSSGYLKLSSTQKLSTPNRQDFSSTQQLAPQEDHSGYKISSFRATTPVRTTPNAFKKSSPTKSNNVENKFRDLYSKDEIMAFRRLVSDLKDEEVENMPFGL